jgi:restriction system protein
MAVPDFQTLMLPVLQEYSDGKEHLSRHVRDDVARKLSLSAHDIAERLPTSPQTRFANRVAWAHSYLKQSGLLVSPRRGHYRISDRGTQLLASPPERIDIAFLQQYPEFQEFRTRGGATIDPALTKMLTEGIPMSEDDGALTPDEQVRVGAGRFKGILAAQLMGYRGSHEDAARVVGRSGDGGIDGVIKEDRLGLESIYVQAKRWEGSVGRPTIQQFAGALAGHHARKGVVITTSTFTQDAVTYAKTLQTTIVLIDGTQLADLMIEFGVGVSDVETIRLRKVDEDYFAEE